jgi:flagellar assembly protein FliH
LEFDPHGGAVSQSVHAVKRYVQSDLDAARAEGLALGRADAAAKAEQAVAQQIQACAQAMMQMQRALQAETRMLREEARVLAMARARQAAEAALDAYGDERLAAAFDVALETLGAQARVVVRLAPDALERIKPVLQETAAAHGFSGSLVLRPLPAAAPGDVVIDWGDGAIAIDLYDAFERLDRAVETASAEAENTSENGENP